MKIRSYWIVTIFFLAICFALTSPLSQAATITVTTSADNLIDDNDCTLREAIISANNDSNAGEDACTAGNGADTIILPSGTITLAIAPDGTPNDNLDGDFDITDDLTIIGQGASLTTISGDNTDRIFDIGVNSSNPSVTISSLTLTLGLPSGDGGAIQTTGSGSFELSGVVITANNTVSGFVDRGRH